MSQVIDIYECPARDEHGNLPVVYMTAVMSVGLPHNTQFRGLGWAGWGSYAQENDNGADWNWASYDYRIDPALRPVGGDSVRAFKVGDWVVCIDTSAADGRLQQDAVYHIVAVRPKSSDTCLDLEGQRPAGWFASRFRHASNGEVAAHLSGQVADGHNLDKLTVGRVGDGYRLLTIDEIKARRAVRVVPTGLIQAWDRGRQSWSHDKATRKGDDVGLTYRTKLSATELAALIAPKRLTKRALTPDDLPAVWWVRRIRRPDFMHLVIEVSYRGISIMHDDIQETLSWDHMMDKVEWSADRKVWHPAFKMVES